MAMSNDTPEQSITSLHAKLTEDTKKHDAELRKSTKLLKHGLVGAAALAASHIGISKKVLAAWVDFDEGMEASRAMADLRDYADNRAAIQAGDILQEYSEAIEAYFPQMTTEEVAECLRRVSEAESNNQLDISQTIE